MGNVWMRGPDPLRSRRLSFALTAAIALLAVSMLAGCSSATVDATIDNESDHPIQLLEVSYPSASFGTGSLASHAQFHYRFKIQGSGAIKLHYIDAANKSRDFTGPDLHEGQQGSLAIIIDSSGGVGWKPLLATRRSLLQ